MSRTIAAILSVAAFWWWSMAVPSTYAQNHSFVKGVSLYMQSFDALQYSQIEVYLDRQSALGVNTIVVSLPIFTDSFYGTYVYTQRNNPSGPSTPLPEDLHYLLQAASNRGIEIWLSPLVDEGIITATAPNPGDWRGTIQLADKDRWFSTYGDVLVNYIGLVHTYDLGGLVIGRELDSLETLEYEPYWQSLIERLRGELAGNPTKLMYAQNWGPVSEGEWPSWLAQLDSLAIDAYFPARDMTDLATADDLVAALSEHSDEITAFRNNFSELPLYFMEVGISSVSNVYWRPWMWEGNIPEEVVSLHTQATFYQAACQYYSSLGDGIVWWGANLFPPVDPAQDRGFDFSGKPAEEEVSQCFNGNG